MQWVIPNVAQTRDLDEWWDEDVLCQHDIQGTIAALHVPDPSDFCKRCGADLHVTRLRVKRVSYSDSWRLHICKAAWDSGPDCGEQAAQAAEEELDRLGISTDDREKMVDLYLQGCEIYVYCECGVGLHEDLVGITADGMFLYAAPGEYEIGSETWLRFGTSSPGAPPVGADASPVSS